MKVGQPGVRGVIAAIFLLLGGCAIGPGIGSGGGSGGKASQAGHPIAERDMLAEAARAVETANWPDLEPAPMFSWITGGGDEARFTRADAVAFYLQRLETSQDPFSILLADADGNIAAAATLRDHALAAADAPRTTMNDVALVEGAIQTLREHRDIYNDAAKDLYKSKAALDEREILLLRRRFDAAIRDLGNAADLLAERIDHDHSATLAQPSPAIVNKFSDL